MANSRYWLSFGILATLIAVTGWVQGWSVALSLLTVGLISAVMALGLNMQWGYAGLFNAGVMGFSAIGAIACVLVSMPWVTASMSIGLETLLQNPEGQQQAIETLRQDLPRRLVAEQQIGVAWLIGAVSAVLAWGINWALRSRFSGGWRAIVVVVILAVGLVLFQNRFDPAIRVIESTGFGDDSKYLGGLQLPILLAWFVGGGLAALAEWQRGSVPGLKLTTIK